MNLRDLCLLSFVALSVALSGCTPDGSPQAAEGKACAANLAPLLDRQLGSEDAPVHVVTFLPVNNGCQDVIGEYLAEVAERFPDIFQVRILDMKDPKAKEIMTAHGIRCAAVMVDEKTTFDLGGEDGKFILEGPMDPRDIERALLAAGKEASGGKELDLPEPPEQPGIENMPKRTP
jgi:hypothetical protein